ncbi:MAG: glycosyltransferase [Acidimicrobiia bacterium]
MRVLFTTTAGLGHIHPTVPLARAMADRGHDVLWAAPADGLPAVEAAGFRAVRAGGPGITDPAGTRRRFPELDAYSPAELPEQMFAKLFGAVAAPAMLADLLPVAREWRPELVVADQAEFAGHIAAADLGVPSVTKGFGPVLPEARVARAADEVAPLWRSVGLEPRPYGGAFDRLYLDIYPPALQDREAAHIPHRLALRPVAYDGAAAGTGGDDLPLPAAHPGTPLVYVTMGTVFTGPEALAPVLAAVADLEVRVVVTVGPRGDPAVLGPQPPHVRVERYVPQTALLPRCDVVVSHAGSGTVLQSLGLRLPQLCLPQGADQFLNASAVTSAGAGIALEPGGRTPEAVGHALGRLLGDPSYRAAAGRVAESIASMPPPETVAETLEQLV